MIVSTRPQGYEGELDDLDAIELRPLPAQVALDYGERLLKAWSGRDASSEVAALLEKMRGEFAKPEVADLLQTPLHTTMAALLVASRGSLPSARSMLFEHFFSTILRRELTKPFDHGIQDTDEGVLRALHARAGMTLQVRSQAQMGARSSLRRRELRTLLAAIYADLGVREDDARAQVDRIMRFAAERLVLLLHSSEGEYEFGVRSLQEFFAAQELLEGEAAMVRGRLDAIALDPHWTNVLAFVVSSSETERYGKPWPHEPLWEIALKAAASPTQTTYVHRRSLSAAFASPEAWRAHDFPLPFLALMPPPRSPSRILGIQELTNLRLFKETPTVDVPFPQPAGDRGQWIVLVGENGVGKTTLLRSVALTLASPTIASKLLDERLPMLRNGSEARVSLQLDTGTLSISVLRGERTERVESSSPPDVVRPWVVGYGVRRGNARGEKDREAEVGPIGELHTLFDQPASLHNAVQWLKDLDADVLREQRKTPRPAGSPPGPREGVWRSVQNALQVLLGVTKVEVDDGGAVYVKHPQFDRVRLDALSDGYLTTAGWVIDMVARWIDRQQELDEPVGADVLRQMCGFVLLDEIDLHLHPMWQMRIIEDVRRLFPRLSFVVTTHNPLTLQGARRGEVYVMRRDGSRIELIQRDIRPGHDVDRVLFEQFGVEHTFDRQTRDLLDRHREILEKGVGPEPWLSKCVWCEQVRPAKRELDVEHYRPKGRVTEWDGTPPIVSDTPPPEIHVGPGYWWLAFEWTNYSLACKTCNAGWKRNLFPVAGPRAACAEGVESIERPLLLDPGSAFRTRDHFRWTLDGIVEPASSEGYATIVTCGLNRRDLRVRRAKVAFETSRVLDQFVRALRMDATAEPKQAQAEQARAYREIQRLGSRTAEFTSMVRWLVEERLACDWDDLDGMPP